MLNFLQCLAGISSKTIRIWRFLLYEFYSFHFFIFYWYMNFTIKNSVYLIRYRGWVSTSLFYSQYLYLTAWVVVACAFLRSLSVSLKWSNSCVKCDYCSLYLFGFCRVCNDNVSFLILLIMSYQSLSLTHFARGLRILFAVFKGSHFCFIDFGVFFFPVFSFFDFFLHLLWYSLL